MVEATDDLELQLRGQAAMLTIAKNGPHEIRVRPLHPESRKGQHVALVVLLPRGMSSALTQTNGPYFFRASDAGGVPWHQPRHGQCQPRPPVPAETWHGATLHREPGAVPR